jgi:hypothetical protein
VRKANEISAGTPAVKKRHRRYFLGISPNSPVVVLKTTWQRETPPEASLHSAPVHKTSRAGQLEFWGSSDDDDVIYFSSRGA